MEGGKRMKIDVRLKEKRNESRSKNEETGMKFDGRMMKKNE